MATETKTHGNTGEADASSVGKEAEVETAARVLCPW